MKDSKSVVALRLKITQSTHQRAKRDGKADWLFKTDSISNHKQQQKRPNQNKKSKAPERRAEGEGEIQREVENRENIVFSTLWWQSMHTVSVEWHTAEPSHTEAQMPGAPLKEGLIWGTLTYSCLFWQLPFLWYKFAKTRSLAKSCLSPQLVKVRMGGAKQQATLVKICTFYFLNYQLCLAEIFLFKFTRHIWEQIPW